MFVISWDGAPALLVHFLPGDQSMTRTAFLLALAVTALANMPAHAQQRVFVSTFGSDSNPCSQAQPCLTFQQAYNTAAANAVINVLDPGNYGPLVITHGISVQGHGFAGIVQTCGGCAAITVAVTNSDPVTLNGLLLDGGGTGEWGIKITSGPSVQILNSVARHFLFGIGIVTTTNSNLLIEDTIASDNGDHGIAISPPSGSVYATLNRITANNNSNGVFLQGHSTTIANSVLSNNSSAGASCYGFLAWLATNVISGNGTGVAVGTGTVNSYGNNYIKDNGTPVSGSLTSVAMQ
jgi:hypothetical protein